MHIIPATCSATPITPLPRRTFLMEIKDPAQPPSKRQLTEGEAKFRETWRGSPYHVVHTADEAIQIITTA